MTPDAPNSTTPLPRFGTKTSSSRTSHTHHRKSFPPPSPERSTSRKRPPFLMAPWAPFVGLCRSKLAVTVVYKGEKKDEVLGVAAPGTSCWTSGVTPPNDKW